MTRVSTTVEVEAPLERVWEVVSDPRNLPRWDRHITAVEGVPDSGLEEGTTYETELRFMGLHSHVHAEVEELDPPSYARIRLSGLLEAEVITRLAALDGGRTRLEQVVDFEFRGGTLARMASRGLRLTGGPAIALRRGVAAQKRQAEEG
ncbi:MAG: SRPBCC family protein [Actinobacteria bacterium]|nr:SRPBCC family protein [Actinomycetota bacterium]